RLEGGREVLGDHAADARDRGREGAHLRRGVLHRPGMGRGRAADRRADAEGALRAGPPVVHPEGVLRQGDGAVSPADTAAGCTVAGYLALRLAEIGAGHIFAVPGDYAGAFLSTIDNDPSIGVMRVGTCNELEAGYAADAYARQRGAGVACVTFGVGTFSILN